MKSSDRLTADENLFGGILDSKIRSLFYPTFEKLLTDELKEITNMEACFLELCTKADIEKAEIKLDKKIKESNREILYECSPYLKTVENDIRKDHHIMVKELIENIEKHKEEIERKLLKKSFHKIVSVSYGDADTHNHGKLAMIIETDGGKFLYKPHSLAIDRIAKTICERFFSDMFYIPECLDYGDYGFCEFVINEPASDENSASKYYYNLGGFLAFIMALRGSDYHFNNFLARGVLPVPIDFETLINPKSNEETNIYQNSFLKDCFLSALRMILLPCYDERLGEISPVLRKSPDNISMPEIDGVKKDVLGYRKEFLSGFDDGYMRILANKDSMKSLLDVSSGFKLRYIVRKTIWYVNCIEVLNEPSNAQNIDGQNKIYDLQRKKYADGEKDLVSGILDAEVESLSVRDIPFFYTLDNSRDLYCDGKIVQKDYFVKSVKENAKDGIDRFSEREKEFEKALIERTLDYAVIRFDKPISMPEIRGKAYLSEKEAFGEAKKIFRKIVEESVVSPSGVRGILSRDESITFCLNEGFGKGISGVMTFIALMSFYDKECVPMAKEIGEFYLSFIDDYIYQWSKYDTTTLRQCNFGLSFGLGGILVSLFYCKKYMPDLVADDKIKAVLSAMDYMPVNECTKPDTYEGLSGLIIALSKLNEYTDTSVYIKRAADRLLELFRIEESADYHTSGYAHGMVGIGYGFLCAYEILKDENYLNTAKRAYAFEHSAYSEKLGAWPAASKNKNAEFRRDGICSGAPGIAMCMKKAKEFGFEYAGEDFEKAVNIVKEAPLNLYDTLCCSNISLAESLIEAELLDEAAVVLGKVIEKKEKMGYFYYGRNNQKPVFSPSLLSGEVGIGYVMLRYATKGKVPSVFM